MVGLTEESYTYSATSSGEFTLYLSANSLFHQRSHAERSETESKHLIDTVIASRPKVGAAIFPHLTETADFADDADS